MTLRFPICCLIRRGLLSAGLLFSSVLAVVLSFAPDVRATSTVLSSSYLNLRSAPAATSVILMIVPPGTALLVRGDSTEDYVPVVYGEHAGWVASDLVQLEMRNEPAAAASFDQSTLLPEGMATLVESLNLRSGPGASYDAIEVIDAGTQVKATGEVSGSYEKIKVGETEGWVSSIYVDRGPHSQGGGNRQADIVATAVQSEHPLVTPGLSMVADAEIVLRQEPSAASAKLTVVPMSSKIVLTGNQHAGFLEAQFEGKTGWVAGGYLRQGAPPGNGPLDIPVLMYHSIQATGGNYQVTAAQLDEQLRWLSQNGYESVTSADLLAWMTYGVPLPAKPVLISIDDGNASDWSFLEYLERYGYEGVFSLPNYADLTPSQIRTLDRAGEVCGHTVSHPNLSTLSYDEQVYQIVENKKYLEAILGSEIACFAYPFGAYSGLTPFVVIEAGYLISFDVSGGPQPLDGGIDRWHIRRINVNGTSTLNDFIASLGAS